MRDVFCFLSVTLSIDRNIEILLQFLQPAFRLNAFIERRSSTLRLKADIKIPHLSEYLELLNSDAEEAVLQIIIYT